MEQLTKIKTKIENDYKHELRLAYNSKSFIVLRGHCYPEVIKFIEDYILGYYKCIAIIKIEFNYCTDGREWWFIKI